MLFPYDFRKAQQLGAEWSASVHRPRPDLILKRYVSAIDFEIDDDAVIREPPGLSPRGSRRCSGLINHNIGHGGENNNFWCNGPRYLTSSGQIGAPRFLSHCRAF